MDHLLPDMTVDQFRQALRDAAAHVDVVEPAALREPISLWLRSVDERVGREQWQCLLGRPTTSPWHAAQAILNEHARRADSR